MADWRSNILQEFVPQVASLTLMADPDGLLLEEGVLAGIRQRGFEVLDFEDPIEFRYALAGKRGGTSKPEEAPQIVVVYRRPADELDELPYGLLESGRRLHFSLGDLFPNLSYPVLAALHRGDLDALYQAQLVYKPGRLGDNATKEFVLRQVFGTAPELIKQPSDFLRSLLRRHLRVRRVPALLDERFIEILRQRGVFVEWPLEKIIPDREAFFQFLQERWPAFLDTAVAQTGKRTREAHGDYHFQIPGPQNLPFDHDDVRVFLDNLFLEGLLHPVDAGHVGGL